MFDKIRKAFGGSEKPKAETKQKIESAPEVEETAAPVAETKQETATNKPRIGYIHLSGCTGDGMSLTENYDILDVVLTEMVDIVYGQTLVDLWEMPEMDLCLIEGSVCLQDEHSVHELLEAREKSALICAFGSCALNGCFTTYARGGQQAQPKHESFLPISSLVKVDVALPGCPVAPEMIAKTVVALCNGDMEYLQPALDLAACSNACGCDLLNNIIRQGLCSGCGSCALACQTRAIDMVEGRPTINTDRCIKCGSCYTMCPRSWLPLTQIKKDTGLQEELIMVLGTYKEAVAARSTDKRIQEVAQDGGIASALLIYALENNIIEGAVVAGDPGDDWVPIPEIATTADEILSAAGTKYSMSPNVWGIKEAARQHGIESIGTVVTPCQMQGIRKMQAYPFSTRFIADKIKLLVGIFWQFPLLGDFPAGQASGR